MELQTLSLFSFQYLTFFLFIFLTVLLGSTVNSWAGLWNNSQPSQSPHENNLFLQWFFVLAVGLFVIIGLMFTLGVFGILYPLSVSLVLFILSIGSIWLHYKKQWNSPIKTISVSSFFSSEFLVVCLLMVSTLIAAIKVPGFWDDTMYHLPLARHYVQTHGLSLNEYYRFPLSPQNYDLLFSWGLMFGNELLAQLIATFPLFVIGLGLIGLSLWLMNSMFLGVLATLLFVITEPVVMHLGYAYIDNALALFCFAAIIATIKFSSHTQNKHWIWIVGVFVGAAIGTKYFGLFCGVSIFFWLLLERKWKSLGLFILASLLFGSWWYLRSFIISGDPVHPIGGKWFGYFLWNAQDLQGQIGEQQSHIRTTNPLMLFKVLHPLEMPILLFTLACLSLVKVKHHSIRLVQITYLIYFIFWFFSNQITRYLITALPLGAFLLVYFMWLLGGWVTTRKNLKPLNTPRFIDKIFSIILLIPLPVMAYQETKIHIQYGPKTILSQARVDSGFFVFEKANGYIPTLGNRLLQFGLDQGMYFFKGQAIGDVFGPIRYGDFQNCDNTSCRLIPPPQMIIKMNQLNIKMLAINLRSYESRIPSDYPQYFNLLARDRYSILLTPK